MAVLERGDFVTKTKTEKAAEIVDVCPNDGTKKADGRAVTRGDFARVECPCGYVFSSEEIEPA